MEFVNRLKQAVNGQLVLNAALGVMAAGAVGYGLGKTGIGPLKKVAQVTNTKGGK